MKKIMFILTIIFVIIGIVMFLLWAYGFSNYISSFQVLLIFFMGLIMFTSFLIWKVFFENQKQDVTAESLTNIKRVIELWHELSGERLTYTDGKCRTKTWITQKGEERTFSGMILEKHSGQLILIIFDWKKKDIFDWDDNPSIDKLRDPLFEFIPFEEVTRQKERKMDRVELVKSRDEENNEPLVDEGKFHREEQ